MTTKLLSDSEAQGGQELLISMGEIMTIWSGVEYAVCEIYLAFFQQHQRDVPSIAYHAVRTFEARRKIVSALIQRYGNEFQKNSWKSLNEKISKRAKIRNAVAHGFSTLFGRHPNRKWGLGVNPYDLEDFSGSAQSNDYHTTKELNEARGGITELIKELDELRALFEADKQLQTKLLHQDSTVRNHQNLRIVVNTHQD